MHRPLHFLAATAALLLGTALSAQTGYEELIRENPERAAGVHHSYEYRPGPETPVPDGYEPFYVSHYGRHGSRRNIGSSASRPYEAMVAARDAGILTPLGEALFRDVDAIHEDHIGMTGELTAKGAREHRALAQRLFERFSGIWSDPARTRVHVQSSNIPRCLVSMANFTSSLDDCAPQLLFDFVTGDKYLDLLAHDYYEEDAVSKGSRALRDSMALASVDTLRLMKAFFIDNPARVQAVIPSQLEFLYYIFIYGGIRQCVETPDADIFGKYFTVDELIALYRCYNSYIYSEMGNSVEYGDNIVWAARDLVHDIIDRAEAAFASDSGTAADLRFGHDSGTLPLVGLMDLVGPGDRVHNYDASDNWQSFFNVPMASNLQMIFFRKPGAEPLVKIYYNERETLVRGLESETGPYYRWSALKAHLERRCEQFDF